MSHISRPKDIPDVAIVHWEDVPAMGLIRDLEADLRQMTPRIRRTGIPGPHVFASYEIFIPAVIIILLSRDFLKGLKNGVMLN